MDEKKDTTGGHDTTKSSDPEDPEETSSGQNVNKQIKTRIEQHLKSVKLMAGQHFKEIRDRVQSLSTSGLQATDSSSAHKEMYTRDERGERRNEDNDAHDAAEGHDLSVYLAVQEVTPNLGTGEHNFSSPMSEQLCHLETSIPPPAPTAKPLSPLLPTSSVPASQSATSPVTSIKHPPGLTVTEPAQQTQGTATEAPETYLISPPQPPPPPPSPRPPQLSPSPKSLLATPEVHPNSPRIGRHLAVHRSHTEEHRHHEAAASSTEAPKPETFVSDVKIFINDDTAPFNQESLIADNVTSPSRTEQSSDLGNKSIVSWDQTTSPPQRSALEEHQNDLTQTGRVSDTLVLTEEPDDISNLPLTKDRQENDRLESVPSEDTRRIERVDESSVSASTAKGQQMIHDTRPTVTAQDISVNDTTSTHIPENEAVVLPELEPPRPSKTSKDRPKIHTSKGKKKGKKKRSPSNEAVTKTQVEKSTRMTPGSLRKEPTENVAKIETSSFISYETSTREEVNSRTLEQPVVSLYPASETVSYSSDQARAAKKPNVNIDVNIPPPYVFPPPVPPRSPIFDSGREPVYRETTVPLYYRPAPTAPPLYSRGTPPTAPNGAPIPRPIPMGPPSLPPLPSYYTPGYSADAQARPFSRYQEAVTRTPPNEIYQPTRQAGPSQTSQTTYRYFPAPESQRSRFMRSVSSIASFVGSKTGQLKDDIARKLSSSVSETDRPRNTGDYVIQQEPGAPGEAINMEDTGRDTTEVDRRLSNDEILMQMVCCCCWPIGLTARILTKMNPSGPRQENMCVNFISSQISTVSLILGVSMYIIVFLFMPLLLFVLTK